MGDLHTSGMALRFCVIGAGSMGSLHGGLLARAGFDVTLLDVWAEHVDAIRREALRLDGITDDVVVRIRATVRAAEVPPADVALVLTDANATVEAAAAARALLRPEGFAVTLQNGIGNVEALAEALGRARVAGGLSYHSAAVQGPGQVSHTHAGPTWLGEPDPMRSIKDFCRAKFNKPSMLQHVEPGKRTEIDALNGAIVRAGRRLGVPTPYNEALDRMVALVDEALAARA